MALLVCGLGCSAESSNGDAPAADGTFSSGLLKVSTVYVAEPVTDARAAMYFTISNVGDRGDEPVAGEAPERPSKASNGSGGIGVTHVAVSPLLMEGRSRRIHRGRRRRSGHPPSMDTARAAKRGIGSIYESERYIRCSGSATIGPVEICISRTQPDSGFAAARCGMLAGSRGRSRGRVSRISTGGGPPQGGFRPHRYRGPTVRFPRAD